MHDSDLNSLDYGLEGRTALHPTHFRATRPNGAPYREPAFIGDRPPLSERLKWAEQELTALIRHPNLEHWLRTHSSRSAAIREVVDDAMSDAFGPRPGSDCSHLFLHRVLYGINRMMLFWYDDLHLYENDRSPYLHELRSSIEGAWQKWEAREHVTASDVPADVESALRQRAAADLDASPSAAGCFFRDAATLEAYRRLVEIASLDGLVEASQLSRILGGVSDPTHSMLTRILLEEYGGGRIERKHSTYFRAMLEALGLDVAPEAYFDAVPWEVLATINHSFLLSDRRRHFLRYVGGLLYTEISVPAAFRCFVAASERLGLSTETRTYWQHHIDEDAHHGAWMLDSVAIPLVSRYPADAWEIVLGYDQQRRMSSRASEATARCAGALA